MAHRVVVATTAIATLVALLGSTCGSLVSTSTVAAWATRSSLRPLLLHLRELLLLLHEHLALAGLGELGEELEQSQQELPLLRSEIVAEFLQLFHVFLDFLALLVPSELNLVDAFKHVGSSLLTRLELADEERSATERPL